MNMLSFRSLVLAVLLSFKGKVNIKQNFLPNLYIKPLITAIKAISKLLIILKCGPFSSRNTFLFYMFKLKRNVLFFKRYLKCTAPCLCMLLKNLKTLI